MQHKKEKPFGVWVLCLLRSHFKDSYRVIVFWRDALSPYPLFLFLIADEKKVELLIQLFDLH